MLGSLVLVRVVCASAATPGDVVVKGGCVVVVCVTTSPSAVQGGTLGLVTVNDAGKAETVDDVVVVDAGC